MVRLCQAGSVAFTFIAVCFFGNVGALSDVCFDYLGCFSMSSPWYTLSRPIPAPHTPSKVGTQFTLYTRSKPRGSSVTKTPVVTLHDSDFDAERASFFLTHGFLAHADMDWLVDMKNALLDRYDANVFIVNWLKGASMLNYMEVVANTRIVGAEVARVIDNLLEYENATTSRMHLIGHSLGAHVMSYVAKRVPNIARLTALDPAQPGFEGYVQEVRLDRNDAQFVEVIHTNGKPFVPLLGAGMVGAAGHVDFYINGGWDQPGCLKTKANLKVTSLLELAKLSLDAFADYVKCPHERSIYILIASIRNPNCLSWGLQLNPLSATASVVSSGITSWWMNFQGCSRDTCSPLGFETVNYPARGSFVLATTGSEPFCIRDPAKDEKMAKYRTQNDIV